MISAVPFPTAVIVPSSDTFATAPSELEYTIVRSLAFSGIADAVIFLCSPAVSAISLSQSNTMSTVSGAFNTALASDAFSPSSISSIISATP